MANPLKIGIATFALMMSAAVPGWATPLISEVGIGDTWTSSGSGSHKTYGDVNGATGPDAADTSQDAVTLTGGALGGKSMTVYAGQIDLLSASLGDLGTWCVDLFDTVSVGSNSYNATVTSLPSTLSAKQDQEIAEIAAFGNAVLENAGDPISFTNPANSSTLVTPTLYAGSPTYATNRTFTAATLTAFNTDLAKVSTSTLSKVTGNAIVGGKVTGSGTQTALSAFSAAIQASIWTVEYGTTATVKSSVVGGVSNATFVSDFNNDLNLILTSSGGTIGLTADAQQFSNIGGYELELTTLGGGPAQNQFVSQVPEPASLALLGVGLLGYGMIRRRKSL